MTFFKSVNKYTSCSIKTIEILKISLKSIDFIYLPPPYLKKLQKTYKNYFGVRFTLSWRYGGVRGIEEPPNMIFKLFIP